MDSHSDEFRTRALRTFLANTPQMDGMDDFDAGVLSARLRDVCGHGVVLDRSGSCLLAWHPESGKCLGIGTTPEGLVTDVRRVRDLKLRQGEDVG